LGLSTHSWRRNFFFIENNTFEWADFYGATGVPVMDMDQGGRQVFANTIKYGMGNARQGAEGLVSEHL
jgi:hypothetical protein